MYREITGRLLRWKNSRRRKPLIVTGVRQCGKTYIIEKFGREQFERCVTVNFESQAAYAGVFEYDYDVERIVRELAQLTGQKIVPDKTLLFFDEIQACPRAITALKYFCENMPQLHVICAGSLLGVALTHSNISFPVGKVNRMQLYPMNFKEFVIARGYENLIRIFADWRTDREIPVVYAKPMMKLLKEYYAVGGMPEAVQAWTEEGSFESVSEIQNEILHDYEDDFSKYAPLTEVPRIRMVWESVPVQLAKENNKFVFSHVKAGKRAADLEDALQWLSDAGLIYRLYLTESPEIPLAASANHTWFKIYMSDIGLLRAKSGLAPETIAEGNPVFLRYKGAFAENFVYNELTFLGITPYFWRSGNTAELDFLFDGENTIIPVEVKAADNVQAKSYRMFCRKFSPEVGFKLSLKNIAENMCEGTRTVNLPLYLVWNLKKYM